MLLDKACCYALLAAVGDGLSSLSSLEFEHEEDGTEISDKFREIIVRKEFPMKVSIHAPTKYS